MHGISHLNTEMARSCSCWHFLIFINEFFSVLLAFQALRTLKFCHLLQIITTPTFKGLLLSLKTAPSRDFCRNRTRRLHLCHKVKSIYTASAELGVKGYYTWGVREQKLFIMKFSSVGSSELYARLRKKLNISNVTWCFSYPNVFRICKNKNNMWNR
jgi:hypothetical protein